MKLLRNNGQIAVQGVLLGLRESQDLYTEVIQHTNNNELRKFANTMRGFRAAQCARVSAFIRLLDDLPSVPDRDSEQCRLFVANAKWQLSSHPLHQQIESLKAAEVKIKAQLQEDAWPANDKVAELLKKRIFTSCDDAIKNLNAIAKKHLDGE